MKTFPKLGFNNLKNEKKLKDTSGNINKKHKVNDCDNNISTFKVFDYENINSNEALSYYNKFQVLIIRNNNRDRYEFKQQELKNIYNNYKNEIEETFTIENLGESNIKYEPNNYFKGDVYDKKLGESWYISYIIQKSLPLLEYFSNIIPFKYPLFFDNWGKIFHYNSYWLFNGYNNTGNDLQGRVEHTDSVVHSGTWHYQLSGSKSWVIRPLITDEWKGYLPILDIDRDNISNELEGGLVTRSDDGINRIKIELCKNDIIIINTRMWWHQTFLPCSNAELNKNKSISVARDFKFMNNDDIINEVDENMSNKDGIYAAKSLRKGDIVCTEKELPDCSLPRLIDANCEVSSIKQGKKRILVLIAKKNINSGDWLSVAPSSDEDNDNYDDDDDDDYNN